jgi:hypothetical protein
LADLRAEPPPKLSVEPSALVRLICAGIPPATVALRKPSSVSPTQMTLSVWVASEPPEAEAASAGVAVVPSAKPALPPRMICSSCSISDSSSACAATARRSSKPWPA